MSHSKPKHVVVGGGTSSVMLCRQLLDAGNEVILLERGPERATMDTQTVLSRWIHNIFNIYPTKDIWTFEARDRNIARQLFSAPQTALCDRIINYSSAQGIGGNSNVNAMIADIGSDFVYDTAWPKSWNSHSIHKYVRVVDNLVAFSKIATSGNMKLLMESIGSTETQQIYPEYCATIDPQQPSKRWRLENVLNKTNYQVAGQLQIVYNCTIDRIIIENNCATAVIDQNGNKYLPQNGGEIIVCCGAFETPKLLHRSGVPLRGIGKRLQDHVIIPYIVLGSWYKNWSIFKSEAHKIPQYPLNGVHGWVFLDENGHILDKKSDVIPRCQLLFVDGFISSGTCDLLVPNYSKNYVYSSFIRPFILFLMRFLFSFSLMQWLTGNVQGVLVCLVQPHSTGNFNAETGVVDPRFLQDSRDLDSLRNAVLATEHILRKVQSSNPSLWFLDILPGPMFNIVGNTTDYIRSFATTYYHPCGTCRMGSSERDENAVVDENLKVIGIDNLRIADASVIPHIPNVPIAKLCMAIGVGAAERLVFAKNK